MSDRLGRFRELLRELKLDGALISHPANRFYLSGYTAGDHGPDESVGVLLIGPETAQILASPTYTDWAGAEADGFEVVTWKRRWSTTVAEQIEAHGWKRVGYEDQGLLVSVYTDLVGFAPSVELVPLGDRLEKLRSVKDAGEIASLREALRITDEVFVAVTSKLEPGITEIRAAWLIEREMRERGAEGPAFETIVAAGPHAARPHHRPTERTLNEGEPIIFDLGARVHGYDGDLTRTIWFGEPDDRFKTLYTTVLAAQDAALSGLRAGLTGVEGDALARNVIAAAGYGDRFVHGLGHGVGIRIHESPSLGTQSTDVLQTGEVVTVEPGIYLPDWGGIRIEDVVVIGDGGSEDLTRAPKLSFS
jgi:Xaa-Pro aminopeptidase